MGLPVGAFQLTTGDEFTLNQTFGLPHGVESAASQITVQLGSLSASAPYTATRLPAAEVVRVVVLDSEVQRDWLRIRVAVQVRDEHLNPATGSGRVYIQAVQGSGLRDVSASCRPDSTRGTCVATVTVTPSWLDGGDITVSYGLAMNTLHPDVLSDSNSNNFNPNNISIELTDNISAIFVANRRTADVFSDRIPIREPN